MFGDNKTRRYTQEFKQACLGYTPAPGYFKQTLTPALSHIIGSLAAGYFGSAAKIDTLVEPVGTLDPLRRALLAADILRGTGKLPETQRGQGKTFLELVAFSGAQGAHDAARHIIDQSYDRQQAEMLIPALSAFWPYEPSPQKELERAQSHYLKGILMFKTGRSTARDFKERLEQALSILSTVDPSQAVSAARQAQVSQVKTQLEQMWHTTLEWY
jgi:hypothetical protein